MKIQTGETAEVLEAILGSIDEAIHAVNANGITIFYNKIAAEHDGLSIDEVMGKHLLEVFPSLTGETSTLLKVLRTEKPIYHTPQTFKNIRGEFIETVNTTIPIHVNGKLFGAVEIAKDYSKMKLLAEKLTDLQSKISQKVKNPVESTGAKFTFDNILTCDSKFEEVKSKAKKAALSSSSVLIYGETGTGKELLVQAIHNASNRKTRPFIVQNCAALPEALLESILFGTVKGSYTGAVDRAGLLEIAHGGTLFLDEINSMPLELQSKLLRVLEDGMVRRIGGAKAFHVDIRIIAAMNINPQQSLIENKLRPDLFYRLNVFSLEIPPLRNRSHDIILLADSFIHTFSHQIGKTIKKVNSDVYEKLQGYHWPGNVRELKHTIEYALIMEDKDILTRKSLPPFLFEKDSDSQKISEINKSLKEILRDTEKSIIKKALEGSNGNVQQAAKQLKIPRQTLQYKIQKLNL